MSIKADTIIVCCSDFASAFKFHHCEIEEGTDTFMVTEQTEEEMQITLFMKSYVTRILIDIKKEALTDDPTG